MSALRQANQVRGLRAKLKQDLHEGTVRLEQILATRADYLASARGVRPARRGAEDRPGQSGPTYSPLAHISPSKTVGALSERQRARLIELLSR